MQFKSGWHLLNYICAISWGKPIAPDLFLAPGDPVYQYHVYITQCVGHNNNGVHLENQFTKSCYYLKTNLTHFKMTVIIWVINVPIIPSKLWSLLTKFSFLSITGYCRLRWWLRFPTTSWPQSSKIYIIGKSLSACIWQLLAHLSRT